MAQRPVLDLNNLSPYEFQELCAAVLFKHFSPVIEPFGTPGADGGVDILQAAPPRSYDELFDHAFSFQDKKERKSTWVFQCKYTAVVTQAKQAQQIKAYWKKEVNTWKANKYSRDGIEPTHLVLMTNAFLTPTVRKALKKDIPKKIHFEIWDGAKISAFLLGDRVLTLNFIRFTQPSIFPAVASQVLRELLSHDNAEQKRTPTSSKGKRGVSNHSSAPNSNEPVKVTRIKIKELVQVEAKFTEANNSILMSLKNDLTREDTPKDWVDVKLKSKATGFVTVDPHEIEKVFKIVKDQSARLGYWQKYLGEKTTKGVEIINFQCQPEYAEYLSDILNKAFFVTKTELYSHDDIDQAFKRFESRICGLIDSRSFTEAEEALRKFIKGREAYLDIKKKTPNVFYPGSRKFGYSTYGWTFLSRWEHIYENIIDYFLQQKTPDNVLDTIIYAPFGLATTALSDKQVPDVIQNELQVSGIIYRALSQKSPDRLPQYFRYLDSVVKRFKALEYSMDTLDDAKWALEVCKVLTRYLANYLIYALKGDEKLSTQTIINFMYSILSFRLDRIRDVTNFEESYQVSQKTNKEIASIRTELDFAVATYAWFASGHSTKHFYLDRSLEILKGMSLPDALEIYNKSKEDKSFGWHQWWFNPDTEQVYSRHVDHEVFETLVLRLRIGNATAENLSHWDSVQSRSIDDILARAKHENTKIQKLGIPTVITEEQLEALIRESQKIAKDRFDDRTRSIKELDEGKITFIKNDFKTELAKSAAPEEIFVNKVDPTLKAPKYWFAGQYSIHDKVWFVKDSGPSHYSVSTFGSGWAEQINRHKLSALAKTAISKAKKQKYDLASYEDILKQIKGLNGDKFLVLTAGHIVSWNIESRHVQHEYQINPNGESKHGRDGKLGDIDRYHCYELKRGDILVIPKSSFVWRTAKSCEEPVIELIDPKSPTGIDIKKRNPEMDLEMKVLVEAREVGLVDFTGDWKDCSFYSLKNASEEDE